MRTTTWLNLILACAAAGFAGVWLWSQYGPNADPPSSHQGAAPSFLAPSLLAPDGARRHLPSARDVTDEHVAETTAVVATDNPAAQTIGETADLPVIDADAAMPTEAPPRQDADRQTGEPVEPLKPGVAVIPFKLMGSIEQREKEAGHIVADLLVGEIDSDRYTLYERSQITSMLTELRFQATELVDDASKAVRFGKLKGVRYLVLGSISRLGNFRHVSARLVDCKTGHIVERGRVKMFSLDEADRKLPELVNRLGLREGAGIEHNVRLQANELLEAVNPDPQFHVEIRTAKGRNTFVEGDNISFAVRVSRAAFVTLLTVDPAGTMTLLLPNKWQQTVFVHPGTGVSIPKQGADFTFTILPPHGETLVRAIATLRPLKLSNVEAAWQNEQQFASSATKGIKAIGVEGAGQAVAPGGQISLHTALKPSEWSTAEMIVITRPAGQPASAPAPSGRTEPLGLSEPEPFNVGVQSKDPNDRVLARWKELTRSHLPPPPPLLKEAATSGTESTREWLIRYRTKGPPPGTKSVAGSGSVPTGMRVVTLPPDSRTASSRLDELRSNPDVLAVIPNIRLKTYGLPPTKLVSVQWALKNGFSPGNDIGYHHVADKVRTLQSLPLIGLVDTGFNHEDPRLRHAAWTNSGEIPGNGRDDDGNGYVDDVHGWNFIEKSNRIHDRTRKFDHGTFVASIIAARPAGHEMDVVGIAPQAKIVTAIALRPVADTDFSPGDGDLATILAAIRYVVDQGARIVNLSFGRRVSPQTLADINRLPLWDELEKRGVVLVCAAGNDHGDNDLQPVFPACLPRSNVLSVLAVDAAGRLGRSPDHRTGRWSTFSNHGRQTVHIGAPGTLILGVNREGDATLASGTSYAAGFVSAALALDVAMHPPTGRIDLTRFLATRTQRRPSLRDACRTSAALSLNSTGG
jgi:TolB-like protein